MATYFEVFSTMMAFFVAVTLPFGVFQLGRQMVGRRLRRALRIADERKQRRLLGSASGSTVPVAVSVHVSDRR